MDKISVVLASKDPNRKVIQRAVQSILQQTHTNLEVLIVDDGSLDSKRKIFDDLADEDERVKIIHNQTNQGLAYSLNKGIKAATAEYIARMDDDDISLPTRLEKQLHYLKSHRNVGFVGSTAIKFGVTNNDGIYYVPEFPSKKDFLWNSPFIHPTIMYRRSALISVKGYRVSKETRRKEDYDIFMRLYAKNVVGANLNEPLLKYFVNIEAMRKKRKFEFCIDEYKVRKHNFKTLRLPYYRVFYIVKPLLVGLIPKGILYEVHRMTDK